MNTENEKQLEVEIERALTTVEGAISGMERFGGNIHMFSYAMLRASIHLFAEVRGIKDLERATQHLLSEQQKKRQLCGRA